MYVGKFGTGLSDRLVHVRLKVTLTESELENIEEALDSPEVMEKFKVKLRLLRIHFEGIDHGNIARAGGKHPNTITSYLKEYGQGEFIVSLEDRAHRPVSVVKHFLPCFALLLHGSSSF